MSEHDPRAELAALEAVLAAVPPLLRRLRELLGAQRTAIAAGDLRRFLELIEEQEAAGVQLAGLERRRQRLQNSLEIALAAHGLREIAERGCADEAARQRLYGLLDELRLLVLQLRREHERNTALLQSACEAARRARAQLARMLGAEPAYAPVPPPDAARVLRAP